VVWIAGGQLKGVDVDDLVEAVAGRLRGAVLLGQDRVQLATSLARHAPDVPVITVDSTDDGAMTEVVHAAAALARPGDVVLLAPAAASYDMFTGYPARGDAFAAAARALGSDE
jgi:UDP-N-acetylmuramoylalanine--D-glutamate ligase